MTQEKVNTVKSPEYLLSVAKVKISHQKILGEVFMNYLCSEGANIILSEHELNDIRGCYFSAMRGIDELTESS